MKSAASDCLKKCASLAGVALHLYSDPNGQQPMNQKTGSNNNGHRRTNGNNGYIHQSTTTDRITNQKIADIFRIARDAGIPQKDVILWTRESFDTTISGLTPQQGDDLIAMITASAA